MSASTRISESWIESKVSKHGGSNLRGAIVSLATIATLMQSTPAASQGNALDSGPRRSTENSTAAPSTESSPEASLPPLPEIPRLEAPQPTAEEVQELDSKLGA